MKLPGVGPKTSAIVMTYGHFNKDYIPVDTHVNRIPNRLGWIKTKTPEETEKSLMKIIPRKYWQMLNNNFVTCLKGSLVVKLKEELKHVKNDLNIKEQ